MSLNLLFSRLSLKGKTMAAILLVVGAMELLSGLWLTVSDIRSVRKELIESSTLNSSLVAEYCVTPLVFGDVPGAASVLEKTRRIPGVVQCCLYDSGAAVFAQWPANASCARPPASAALDTTSFVLDKRSLTVYAPVVLGGRHYGLLGMVVSLEPSRARVFEHTLGIAAVLLWAFLVSVFLAYLIQRVVTLPILRLAKMTDAISRSADFSTRIKSIRNDEVGVLERTYDRLLDSLHERELERDDALRKLSSNAARLSAILEALPDAVLVLGSDGVVKEHWGLGEQLLPSRESPDGRTVNEIFPSETAEEIRLHLASLARSRDLEVFEYHRAEGYETRHFEVRMIRSSTDEVLAIVRDITEGRNAAAQITQMQKMETVWTLAGGLAHDFNNILTGILGPASMIEADLASGLPLDAGEVRESVKTISASARRASQVVRQLLQMSRRQDAAVMAAMNLNVSLKHVRSVCSSSLDKSVSLNFTLPEGPASIVGDPTQIEQMVLNLCVNAAHAMTIMRPPGVPRGGELRVTVARVPAGEVSAADNVAARPDQVYWKITAADTGVGMDHATIRRIFDPFFTTKGKEHGTGLGLAMVASIVNQHHGFIDVRSEPGVGTNFSIWLPAICDPESATIASIEVPPFPRQTLRILLVDDEEVIVAAASRILRAQGYTVDTATNGSMAEEMFAVSPARWDVVILDLSMPEHSGDVVLKRLLEVRADIKVLMSTGYRQDPRIDACISMGAVGVVEKPYTIGELARALLKAVG